MKERIAKSWKIIIKIKILNASDFGNLQQNKQNKTLLKPKPT
jgi:hypothetical protein